MKRMYDPGWLHSELGKRATDENGEAKYDELKSSSEEDIPPLDAVRARIEQQLRQEALGSVEDDVRKEVKIVYCGSDGKPQTASSE